MAFLTADRKFQLKYILMIILVVGLVSVIIGGGIYYSIRSEVQQRLPDVSEQSITTKVIFSSIDSFLPMLVSMLFIVVVLISILLLNRLASPIFRVMKDIQSLGRGDFTFDSDIRSGEDLSDLVKVLNDTKESLSKSINAEKKSINSVLTIAEDLLKECEKEKINKDKIASLIKKMQGTLDEVQIALSKYRINK